MRKIRKIRENEVTFDLDVEQDDTPVRGNVMASGDDAADKEAEDEILCRLANGNVWAWALVKVTAILHLPDGTVVTGSDLLAGNSYADEADFKRDACYDGMKAEALADLQRELENQITRGANLAELFAEDSDAH